MARISFISARNLFDTEDFLKVVEEKLKTQDSVLVAISEGIKDAEGHYVSEQVQTRHWTISDTPISPVPPRYWSRSSRTGSAARCVPLS